jgi:hypothetical protein
MSIISDVYRIHEQLDKDTVAAEAAEHPTPLQKALIFRKHTRCKMSDARQVMWVAKFDYDRAYLLLDLHNRLRIDWEQVQRVMVAIYHDKEMVKPERLERSFELLNADASMLWRCTPMTDVPFDSGALNWKEWK